MKFKLLKYKQELPQTGIDTCYLVINTWDDYSYNTSFHLYLYDKEGKLHDIGGVRIGYYGQSESSRSYNKINKSFDFLSNEFFSLGMSTEYYKKISILNDEYKEEILSSLCDVVNNKRILDKAVKEKVFKVSLLRDSYISIINGQYTRVLNGGAELTPFNFSFDCGNKYFNNKSLCFNVDPESTPSTNIHTIIGRNGSGKTTLFNEMIKSITDKDNKSSKFVDLDSIDNIDNKNYFSSLVSVSFSAFDYFSPPMDQKDPEKGTCYFYIGLKDINNEGKLRELDELRTDLCESIIDCFSNKKKKIRLEKVLSILSYDEFIKNIKLNEFESIYEKVLLDSVNKKNENERRLACVRLFLKNLPLMSSGHMVVLMSLISLVATVDEKSLVLIDEPECHLHPPLLSAYIRALSFLLYDVNGVAIIATHTPVILQEIPRSCVKIITRYDSSISFDMPKIETFGENVGILTREIFGLEVKETGFTTLLDAAVNDGDYRTFDDIYMNQFNYKIGSEGLILLQTLIALRDNKES